MLNGKMAISRNGGFNLTSLAPSSIVKVMKIKVLPLSAIMSETFQEPEWEEEWLECMGHPIEPIFNRNGYYLDRISGLTWCELNGKAWKYDTRKGFEYLIKASEGNNVLAPDIVKALKLLRLWRQASKKQLEDLYYHECREISRKACRDSQLFVKKMLTKFQN